MVFQEYNKALELRKRALAGREKVLGADHPDTIETIRNMAGLFGEIGPSNQAQEMWGVNI
ncbi:hypothetical protein BDZ91DRAFT_805563 [Kalaharituber pfeilii]|nr:hypothetical protein BDZ91DRAFT_805563 [Kalaharituber pfeilii]